MEKHEIRRQNNFDKTREILLEFLTSLRLKRMKYFRVSLCLETNITTSILKGSGEDEIGTIFWKSDIYDQF